MPKDKLRNKLLVNASKDITIAVIPVLCEVRPAYLIDSVSLPEADLLSLLESFRQDNLEVIALRIDEQVFIAHRRMVLEHLLGFNLGAFQPILIDFPEFVTAGAQALKQLRWTSEALIEELEKSKGTPIYDFNFGRLNTIGVENRRQLQLDTFFQPALAGLLLSYAAVYCPTQANGTVTNQEIDLYSVYLESPKKPLLMQFSAPVEFRERVETSLGNITGKLEARILQIPGALSQKWREYTGGAEPCTLQIQIKTRRVPIMSL